MLQVVLLILFVLGAWLALNQVALNSEMTQADIHEQYARILSPLAKIGTAVKNIRFHTYDGFMSNQKSPAAHYHAYPVELHTMTIRHEFRIAAHEWAALDELVKTDHIHYAKVNELKSQYDEYIRVGVLPAANALDRKDFDTIVKTVTASSAQYVTFETGRLKLAHDIEAESEAQRLAAEQEAKNLRNILLGVFLAVIAGYIGFALCVN